MKRIKISAKIAVILLALTLWIGSTVITKAQPANNVLEKDNLAEFGYALIYLPEPSFKPYTPQNIDTKTLSNMGFEQVYENSPKKFLMRDGKYLFARQFPEESNTTILLLHGVLSNSYMMNKTSGLLREATNSEIISLDFRGHGKSEGTPGDVDYIDQYADDLDDVISAIKKEKPNGKIILAGHSMGGGIILRYAMKKDIQSIDGYLLFAPLLGQNSPTIPQSPAKGSSTDEEPFMKIHLSRIIGLKMLNSIEEHQYDSLPVLFFNLPDEMPVKNYSYRANESMSPEDYKKGLEAVNKPLLVLVGSEDEAFVASEFNNAVYDNSNGDVVLIEGETHNGIRHNENAMQKINEWVKKHNLFNE